ncbi:putative ribonuclease H-like domain-containing protein [Tanacetum coccineum]
MNEFYEMKGIRREFSIDRTPQQNFVAERNNRTLIEAARTMLADSKLPTTFWAEAVNTACYVQNRVLVVKPHNKTPYELFLGRKPALGFMRPFGCPVTILNTLDHLGKFNGKADEGFFIGYSTNSKAFRVFNSKTRIVEENLHVRFNKNTPNMVGSGPNWLFDIDALTKTMNYQPVFIGNQTNGSAGTKACQDADDKKDDDQQGDQGQEDSDARVDQEKEEVVNSINILNAANTKEVNAAGEKAGLELPHDPDMPELEEIVYSEDEDDVGAEADITNLDSNIPVSPIPTNKIHKDHPLDQIIGDVHSVTQTRRMSKNLDEHGLVAKIHEGIKHKDFQNCLFACFLSQIEPKKVIQALADLNWIEAMQEELLQVQLQKEEGIDYNEMFAPVAKIEAIRLFLAYASFMDFTVYQMDVKSAFLYDTIEEEVYVYQPSGFEDLQFYDKVYVDDIIFGSTKKSWCTDQDKYVAEILKKFDFSPVKTASTPMKPNKALVKDSEAEDVDVHLYKSMIVKRIFRYLKGQPKLGLWYPKDLPFDLEAYSDSDYAGASLDRKSTTGGCQFLGKRLISWQCKKQTIAANSTTEAEYVAAANCCGDSYEKRFIEVLKIHTDHNVADLLTKGFDVSRLMLLSKDLMLSMQVNDVRHNLMLMEVNVVRHTLTIVKKVNGVVEIQALVDGKQIVVSKDAIRRLLKFNDEGRMDCLPNATIFEEIARMRYKKLTQKLTFYKAFFSPQWKFLIHTFLHCLSAKTTAWNEFSSIATSAIICLSTNQQFNFSKFILEEGLPVHHRIYKVPCHTKKIFNNMKRKNNDFFGNITPLFPTMVVQTTTSSPPPTTSTTPPPISTEPTPTTIPTTIEPTIPTTPPPTTTTTTTSIPQASIPTIPTTSTQPSQPRKQRIGRRRDTEVTQPSEPNMVEDNIVPNEFNDHLVERTEANLMNVMIYGPANKLNSSELEKTKLPSIEIEVDKGRKKVTKEVVEKVAEVSLNDDEITLAQTLQKLKNTSKAKGVAPKARSISISEPSESHRADIPKKNLDKGKGKMVEPEKPLKRKDQILLDEEEARRL